MLLNTDLHDSVGIKRFSSNDFFFVYLIENFE
jgi:hypothetical protein